MTIENAPDSSDATAALHPTKWSVQIFLLISLLLAVALALYAKRLNERFYSTNQPFFDSLSYNGQIHQVMCIARDQGLLPALATSCKIATLCLPFLIASVLGLVFEPSRMIGIWIQTGELLLVVWSLFYYFTHVRRLSIPLASLAVSPFFFLHCLYLRNGGLSDFRMDLTLMLMFSLTASWYLIAMATERRLHFVLLGVACGLACLSRGTAPIYIVTSLAPLAAVDLLVRRRWRTAGVGLLIAGGVAAALSLWFYVLSYDYLYYYYVIWNPDANAHLPLREALTHLKFVDEHVGDGVLVFAIVFQIVLATEWLLRLPKANWLASLHVPKLNWTALWLAAAPTAMLIARGAGLNPFVCMPSVFGCVLFLLFPLRNAKPRIASRPAIAVLLLTAMFCAAGTIRWGWKDHAGDAPQSMAAHKMALRAIVADAQRYGLSEARFATTHLNYLNPASLEAVAMFDIPEAQSDANATTLGSIRLEPVHIFSLSSSVQWRDVKGSSDSEKIDSLLNEANKKIDYLIIPVHDSAAYVEQHMSFNVINRYATELRDRLLASGQWREISGDIRNSNDEVVRIYRRANLIAATQPADLPAAASSADAAAVAPATQRR